MNIALWQPEIASNVGGIIRTCAAFKCDLFIIHPCGFVWDDRRLFRACMDYVHWVKITHVNCITELPKFRLITTRSDAKTSYKDVKFRGDDMVLFGKESTGLPESCVGDLDVQIPIASNCRSLNVGVAVAIIAAHASE